MIAFCIRPFVINSAPRMINTEEVSVCSISFIFNVKSVAGVNVRSGTEMQIDISVRKSSDSELSIAITLKMSSAECVERIEILPADRNLQLLLPESFIESRP